MTGMFATSNIYYRGEVLHNYANCKGKTGVQETRSCSVFLTASHLDGRRWN